MKLVGMERPLQITISSSCKKIMVVSPPTIVPMDWWWCPDSLFATKNCHGVGVALVVVCGRTFALQGY